MSSVQRGVIMSRARGLTLSREPLSNGVVVTTMRSTTTPAVAVDASVWVGSAQDPAGRPGTANFLGHVLDRGTASRSADEIADALESRGATLKVTVNRHWLTVACTCLAEDFEDVLDVVSDILRQPSFPDTEVAKRRRELLTSLRQDEDDPGTRATEAALELLYGSRHPYGQPTKGRREVVEELDRAALSAFHGRHVVPSSTSLVIVGDVEPDAAQAAVTRTLGDWRGPAFVAPPPATPPARLPRQRLVLPMMDKSQVDIAYGLTAVRRADPAYYGCWIMNHVLGQAGIGGRLGRNIRERQGMAYYAFSSFEAGHLESPLLTRVGVSPDNVERALDAIDEEMTAMAAEGITEAELVDTKRYLVGAIPRRLETNREVAAFVQQAEYFDLGLDYDRRLPDLVRAITRDEVSAIAKRLLSVDHAAIAVAGPYDRA